MTTKTFLFTGYSMRDRDFQEVWSVITKSLGRFAKLAYAIDPHATEERITFWKEHGIQIFKTYDEAFLECLRDRLEKENLIPSRSFLELLRSQREQIVTVHLALEQDSDGGMASSMYQDGLIGTVDDILSSTALGTKQARDFELDLTFSSKTVKENLELNDPVEIAYWSGRHEVLRRFCNRDQSAMPIYFHPRKLIPIFKFVQGKAWQENW